MKDIISADELSNYFILFGSSVGDPITNLKLQKILYYSQAWYLAKNKKTLFEDDFEAWVHGPVIRRIYGKYRSFGYNPIVENSNEGETERKIKKYKETFGRGLTNFLKAIIDEYFSQSAWTLERLVHKESPWIDARAGLNDYELCTNIISKQSMMDYYSKFIKSN